MSSKSYVVLHSCQKKYAGDIITNGLYRDSNAFFIYDPEISTDQQLRDTLAILIYHGVGIHCWNTIFQHRNIDPIDVIKDELVILGMSISQNHLSSVTPYTYYLADSGNSSLVYVKVKEVGPIKGSFCPIALRYVPRSVNPNPYVDPIENRFFSKFTDRLALMHYPEDIKKWCYYVADLNFNQIVTWINQLSGVVDNR